MKFSEQVTHLLEEVKVRCDEMNSVDRKHGVDSKAGFSTGDIDSDWMKEHIEIKQQFMSYLNSLDEETLAKLHSLMYFGRDQYGSEYSDSSLQSSLDYWVSSGRSSKEKANAISEKIYDVPTYFRQAIEMIESKGKTVDTF